MNTIKHRLDGSMNTDRGPSPAIWGRAPWVKEVLSDPTLGVHLYDDFTLTAKIATGTITTQADYAPGYKAFGSSGGTLVAATGNEGGGGIVLTEATDNEGVSLATVALPFRIDLGKGMFCFECRLKASSVADNIQGFFAGLLDAATLSATVPIAADGTLADENLVGFWRREADGDQIDTVYRADGVAMAAVGTDILSTSNTAAGALAADTFVKLGMVFDPDEVQAEGSGILSFYVNNVRHASYKKIPTADGTDFPNDVAMGLVVAMLLGTGASHTVTLDWWRAAQLTAP